MREGGNGKTDERGNDESVAPTEYGTAMDSIFLTSTCENAKRLSACGCSRPFNRSVIALLNEVG